MLQCHPEAPDLRGVPVTQRRNSEGGQSNQCELSDGVGGIFGRLPPRSGDRLFGGVPATGCAGPGEVRGVADAAKHPTPASQAPRKACAYGHAPQATPRATCLEPQGTDSPTLGDPGTLWQGCIGRGGPFDTTKTRSDPQRVRRSSGWREANRYRQRQTTSYRGLVPTPPPPLGRPAYAQPLSP